MPKMTEGRHVIPFADQINKSLNGWVENDSGTTSATITVNASQYTNNYGRTGLGTAIALTDLIVTGTGNPLLTVSSGATPLFSFRTGGSVLTLGFSTLPITVRGENLVITVTGADADASITALGFSL